MMGVVERGYFWGSGAGLQVNFEVRDSHYSRDQNCIRMPSDRYTKDISLDTRDPYSGLRNKTKRLPYKTCKLLQFPYDFRFHHIKTFRLSTLRRKVLI